MSPDPRESVAPESSDDVAPPDSDAPTPASLHRARQEVAMRRRRQRVFADHTDIFGEPAWNMLLDLYIARHEGRHVTVSNACHASGASITTGLRWVATLAERGLVERTADTSDGRRSFVQLTDMAAALVERSLV